MDPRGVQSAASGALDRGRAAYQRRAWASAADELTAAAAAEPLSAPDLESLAVAAYLAGRDQESAAAWERAHQEYLRLGNLTRAVRCGHWLSMALFLRGETARGGGWIARCQRLLDSVDGDCAERGFLLLPAAFAALFDGGAAAAYGIFEQAVAIGERFAEVDLVAIARHGQGQALIRQGHLVEGVGLLDEVMTSVTAGEVGPITAGIIYCAVVETCQEILDLRRANEWTVALTDWCAGQPELVPYRGQCLVHRSEVMQQAGEWSEAMAEARTACARLAEPTAHPALGRAMYQVAELHRLRGELAEADDAYRRASEAGHYPQPGLALLRLAQGRAVVAAAAIRGAVEQTNDFFARTRLLAPCVEVMLATGDVAGARKAAEELTSSVGGIPAPVLRALAAHARGSVSLAEGNPAAALSDLTRADDSWRSLQLTYERARTRVLIGLARRELGDADTAELDLDGARSAFVRLGATTDLDRLDRLLSTPAEGPAATGLSPRELEVLKLVATGRSNQAVAAELVLSEKTVARHLSNIFAKLGLSSRSAATAYAYEHHLV
jgi:DNA-binding CsgD family transcriptional regulator